MRLGPVVVLFLSLASAPVVAQEIMFGDDNSRWANDGECDDPRFEGAGMTQTPLLDDDIKHDATDCRTAFEAGTISVKGSAAMSPKMVAADMILDGINFGNDSGEWNNDGECDDRRFFGAGMAENISWENVGRDATDCSAALQNGTVRLWDYNDAKAATQCSSIDFGADTGAYPNDMECDDKRFEGPGAAMNMSVDNVGGDASDCAALCTYGVVFLRDYP